MAADDGLRGRLVRAGTDLLGRDGLDGLGLRAITREAGVSHGAPRRYFPTHRDLLAAVARSGFDDLLSRFQPIVAGSEDPTDKLTALGIEFVEFAVDRPAMFELMFRHDPIDGGLVDGAPLREVTLPLFAAIVELVDAAVADCDDAAVRSLALWTNVHGIAVLAANRSVELVAGPVDLRDLIARAVHAHLAV
ncbi:TetR/AcrR family transcriptional regulator [Antrihabitans cavernicola]|uniref:TetR/AcrR family transcriptional regulator n=1 Tax=Antrihabitans cavernicola TaxID=2495913 RepID=UPI001F316563|nr:TetR/AcrR family transcriptional regulator [Spelaeibacter cavernicola]